MNIVGPDYNEFEFQKQSPERRVFWGSRILVKLHEFGKNIIAGWQSLVSKIQGLANAIFQRPVIAEKENLFSVQKSQPTENSLTNFLDENLTEKTKIEQPSSCLESSSKTLQAEALIFVSPLMPEEVVPEIDSSKATTEPLASIPLPNILKTDTSDLALTPREIQLLQKTIHIWRPIKKGFKKGSPWKTVQKMVGIWTSKGVREGVFSLYLGDYRGECLTEEHSSKSQLNFELYQKYWNTNKGVLKEKHGYIWVWLKHLQTHPKDRPTTLPPLPTKSVTYVNSEKDRVKFLAASRDGLLYQGDDLVGVGEQVNKEYAAVVGLDGQFYVNIKERDVFQHSSFFGGKPVLSACCFQAKNGKISEIVIKSGHYLYESIENDRAQIYAALKTIQVLVSMKIDLSQVCIKPDPEKPNLFGKKLWNPLDFFKNYNTFTSVFTSTEDAIAEKLKGHSTGSWILWKPDSEPKKTLSLVQNSGIVHVSVEDNQIMEDLVRKYGSDKQITS